MPKSGADESEAADSSARLLLTGTPKRFRNMSGVRRFVAQVLWTLERGGPNLNTDTARVMLYGAKILSELITQGVLEQRLKELELRVADSERERSSGLQLPVNVRHDLQQRQVT